MIPSSLIPDISNLYHLCVCVCVYDKYYYVYVYIYFLIRLARGLSILLWFPFSVELKEDQKSGK